MKALILSTAFLAAVSSCAVSKIQDCPETKIINRMPTIGESKGPSEYYIYKGERREIAEFDQEWIKRNCPNLKVEEVY